MDIRDYLRVVRASWALLVLGLVLGAAVAGGVSLLLPKQYTVSSQLFVSTPGAPDLATAVSGNQYSEQKVASYAALLTSKDLATSVIDDLGLDRSPQALIEQIEASVVQDTTILDVEVTDPSPQLALDIARSINAEFRTLVRRLETPDGDSSPIRVTIVATPEAPEAPSSPAVVPNTVLGAIIGLVLAGLVAVLRDRLDTTVKDDESATAASGAPVIGHVPQDGELGRTRVLEPHSTSTAAEAVRQIRTNLAFLDVDDPPRSIMVTSSIPGEGKTTLAANLAVALAESGLSVTLVEADLRRPQVTRYLGLVEGAGLTDVLTGRAALEAVVQEAGTERLQVLSSGPIPPNPSELLSSAAMATLVRQLEADRDIVLIDVPPALPVADASAMAGLVDGVILCARWGSVTTNELERSATILDRLGAHVLGLVLTMVPGRAAPVSYGYESENRGAATARPSLLARVFGRRRVSTELPPVPPVRPRTAAEPRNGGRSGVAGKKNRPGRRPLTDGAAASTNKVIRGQSRPR